MEFTNQFDKQMWLLLAQVKLLDFVYISQDLIEKK